MAEHVNGRLHYEQLGKQGPLMAFVHPNPMDHTCWVYQMAHFETWFRTIGIDIPGYGRSPTATVGLTMGDIAQACWEAVDEVAAEPAVLVGLSVGVRTVLHMAHLRPERTRAIILSGSGYSEVKTYPEKRMRDYGEQGVAFRHEHTFQDFSPAFRATEMAKYFAQIFSERNQWADAPTIIEQFRALGQPDPPWLFAEVKAPTLVITGSEDSAHPTTRELQARIPDCERVIIWGAGHACNMEQPWAWDAAALAFLRKHGLVQEAAAAAATRG